MKTLFLALMISFTGSFAKADTIAVEFAPCSGNSNFICALVYIAAAPVEMGVQADAGISQQILGLIGPHGRTLAMNVEGRVVTVNRIGGGGQYSQLQVYSLRANPNAPRPRGF